MSAEITTMATIVPHLVQYVPGCPDEIMLRAVLDAAQEFCRDTEIWREELKVIDVTAYQLEYTLTSYTDWAAYVERIVWVKNEGAEIGSSFYDLIDDTTLRFTPDGVPTDATDTISAYSAAATYAVGDEVKHDDKYWSCVTAITVAEAWTQSRWERISDGMYVKAVLRPYVSGTDLPAGVFDRWGRAIAAGAASVLMMQPAKPWTNQAGAAERRHFYNRAWNDASGEATRKYKTGNDSWSA